MKAHKFARYLMVTVKIHTLGGNVAVGITAKEFRQKKSKAMDMGFYWINDKTAQGQSRVLWRPGPEKLGDYHSKHHPPEHHIDV